MGSKFDAMLAKYYAESAAKARAQTAGRELSAGEADTLATLDYLSTPRSRADWEAAGLVAPKSGARALADKMRAPAAVVIARTFTAIGGPAAGQAVLAATQANRSTSTGELPARPAPRGAVAPAPAPSFLAWVASLFRPKVT